MPAISRGRGPVAVLITTIDRKSWLVSPREVFDNGGPGGSYQNGTLYAHRSRFQGSKMDILVADDDSSGRFLLNSTLVELGHSVIEATTGFDSWEASKRGHHQLVISDWMMPGIDGLELCRRIRAEEAAGFAYIILITARAGKANYLDAMDSGVDDFLH